MKYVKPMKQIRTYTLACLALLLASCNNDGGDFSDGTHTGNRNAVSVTFSLSSAVKSATGELMNNVVYPTATEDILVGEQHTKTVYLYIFQGQGEEGTCVACENVGWEDYFGDGLPVHTDESKMTYEIAYEGFQYGIPYTLMAVGLSEGAETVYGFPDGITTGQEGTPGTKLGEAAAILQQGQTTEGIRSSEVYVGRTDFALGSATTPTIELFRRVAAVAGYFKNIPEQLRHPDTQALTNVTTLRLALYTQQNTRLPLVERAQSPVFRDFIDSPAEPGSEVLASMDLTGGNYFTAAENGDIASGACYLLPIPSPDDNPEDITGESKDYTLCIELVAEDGTVLRRQRAMLPEGDELDPGITGGGTGIIDSESAYRYPIVANHFYAFGDEKHPIDLKGNGADLTITVDPAWKGEENLGITEGTTEN